MVGSVFGILMLPMFGVGVLGPGVSVGGAEDWDVLQAANITNTKNKMEIRLSCIKFPYLVLMKKFCEFLLKV
jgi:hypothetical protein